MKEEGKNIEIQNEKAPLLGKEGVFSRRLNGGGCGVERNCYAFIQRY